MRVLALALTFTLTMLAPAAYADDNENAAKVHYEAGRRAYNLGDYDLAIDEWKAGYKLFGAADFLFNVAQAYRQKKDYEQAVFFFQAYLREKPNAANVGEVQALLTEMTKLAEEQKNNHEMPPKDPIVPTTTTTETPETIDAPPSHEPTPTTTPVTAPVTDVARAGRGLRLGGMITAGAGAAVLLTGIVLMVKASSDASDLESAASSGQQWSPAYADQDQAARRGITIGTALTITGGVALAAGTVLYLYGVHARHEAQRVAVVPSIGPRGARVLVSLEF
jgi:tetratricopeptide (TPR) repeat protein